MNSIFKIKSSEEFLEHALNTYEYQIQHCKVYKEYVERLNLGWDVSILNQTTIPAWQGSIEQQ